MPQDGACRLLLTLGTIENERADQVSVLLDLDYLIVDGLAINEAALPNSLDKAHACIEEAFESCLTDELRHQFNREV